MTPEKFYAMIGDMRREQEFYCAQPIFAEFIHAHEFEAVKKMNAEHMEALEECQWGARHMGVPACPQCGWTRDLGHSPQCIVGKAIAKAKAGAA